MSKQSLVFYSPSHFERWDYRNPDTVGIGGSETSAIEMAIRLAARGHDVTSYSPLPADCPDREYAGVHWRDLSECDFTAPGFWMLYRCPDAVDKFDPARTDQQKWLICQDEDYPGWMEGLTEPTLARRRQDGLQRVVALCQAQAAQYRLRYPRLAAKVCVSSNGIKGELVDRVLASARRGSRNPKRILFASSPDRGLAPLLWIFDRARETVPDLELYVAYGFDNIDKIAAKVEATPEAERDPGDARWLKWLHKLKADLQAPGITLTGRLPQPKLYELWSQCGLWVCATRFRETSCQPAGSLIFTRKGMVPIENIKVGDEVLTHKGRFRKVTELKQRIYEGKLYSFRRKKDCHATKFTEEHPIFAATYHKDDATGSRIYGDKSFNESWVPAEKVRAKLDRFVTPKTQPGAKRTVLISDYVSDIVVRDGEAYSPHHKPRYKSVRNEVELTDSFLYVLGIIAAEGCVSRKGGTLTTAHSIKEAAIAGQVAEKFGGKVTHGKGAWLVATIHNSIWARFLRATMGGVGREMRVPDFVWDVPLSGQRAFLQGVLDGDGHKKTNGINTDEYTTVSPSLAYGIAQLLTNDGHFPSIGYSKKRNAYQLSWQRDPMGAQQHIEREESVSTRVHRVESEWYQGMVYNFEVEEDHSYVNDRTIAHNCITSQEAQALGGIPIVLPIWAVGENVEHGTHVTDVLPCTPLTSRAPLNESLVACRFAHEVVKWASDPVAQERTRAQMMPWARQHFHWDRFVDQWEAWMREEIQP